MRRSLLVCVALAGGLIALGVAAAADPNRGHRLWLDNACGACHTLRAAGSTARTAPDIDRWLVPHAARAKLPVETFARSRITWGGRGMTAYGGQLTDEDIDDLVSFIVGRDVAPAEGKPPYVAGFDPPPPRVTAAHATVAGWVKALRLRAAAAQGAAVFAREGCLSCHRYRKSGVRRLGAPELTLVGRKRRAPYLQQYVARPYRYGNTNMPTFVDLGTANLAKLAAFLAASR